MSGNEHTEGGEMSLGVYAGNVEKIEDIAIHQPRRHIPALRTILELTAANSSPEIGLHGPSMAANTTLENKAVPEQALFSDTVYFRDAHVVASFLDQKHPNLTRATVFASIAHIGIREHMRPAGRLYDEQELGKVPHVYHDPDSPKAQKNAIEKDRAFPSYNAIDATGKNINAIAREVLRTPHGLDFLAVRSKWPDGQEHTIEEALHAHVNWIRKRMDLNPDGLVESLWVNKKHHANQSWADSPDSFHHADGSWARHHPDKNWGVAAIDVQAEVYNALLSATDVYRTQLEQGQRAGQKQFLFNEIDDLLWRTSHLKKAVMSGFWVDDPVHYGGYFGRGTDRDKEGVLHPLAIRSSDMGHLLSGLLDGDDEETKAKREAIIRNIFSPEMFAPNGVRTLSSDSVRYVADSYHNGSVWPWQNYSIALDLEGHGYYGLSYEIKKRIWSFYNQTKTLAEHGTGSLDPNYRINLNKQVTVFDPTIFPDPIYHFSRYKAVVPTQEKQAWTAAAVLAMKYEHAKRLLGHSDAKPVAAVNPEKRLFEEEILAEVNSR